MRTKLIFSLGIKHFVHVSCKLVECSLFSLYKHDMSLPICRHSFYRDPCGHKAVRHNHACSECTQYTLLVFPISTKIIPHYSIIN